MSLTEKENLRLQQQLQGHEKKLDEVQKSLKLYVKSLEQKMWRSLCVVGIKHYFVMTDFSKEKLKDKPGDWKRVDANGSDICRGISIKMDLWAMPGEYDHLLKWPAEANLTIELVNQQCGQNAVKSSTARWDKPTCCSRVGAFNHTRSLHKYGTVYDFFMPLSDIHSYLTEDSLHFIITKVKVLPSLLQYQKRNN